MRLNPWESLAKWKRNAPIAMQACAQSWVSRREIDIARRCGERYALSICVHDAVSHVET